MSYMKQFFILIFLLSAFTFVSEAQSKINFEESEVEFVFELEDLIASNGLINTDTLLMQSEHEEAIDVDWFLTYDLPIQDSLRVWGIGLCNETSCFFSESSADFSEFDVTTVPPNYTYSWKFSLVTGDLFDNTDWFLGEGSVILSVVNKADTNDSTSIKVNLKMIDSAAIVEGCTDPEACNYNMDATEDDGLCKLENDTCLSENGDEGVLNAACSCVEVVNIEEFSLLSNSIFPNPSTGLINLQLKDANHSITTLRVNNVQGQQVFSFDDLEPNTSYQFDISALVKGLYQIQLFNKAGYLLHAEIVERQ